LVGASLTGANLEGCRVYAVSTWDVRLDGAIQTNLRITPPDQPNITVDNLEVAQFLYLMLHNEKIRAVIDTLTSKVVLILGRFTPERKAILDALRDSLRQRGYVPVLFDFDGPESRDTSETVTLLARMARFVVADLTDPSSLPLELQAFVPDVQVPVQCLILEGQQPFAMFRDLRTKYRWVLPPASYTTIEDLLSTLPERVIAPAEAFAKRLEPDRADASTIDLDDQAPDDLT
jgi:hypothetical protein